MAKLVSDLEKQLKQEKVAGLPKEWIKGKENKEKTVNLALQSENSNDALVVATLGWDELEKKTLSCIKCRLCEQRNKVVFGVGNKKARLVFVGEGPGADEDLKGEPFVGRAGQLLTAAISKGMGLTREDVYICNVVKCRPPENRAPLPDETASCTPYLYRQLELIKPEVIVTLGQPAQMALSGIEMGITKLRGKWQTWRGIKLMPTFHPAYLLRNPPVKKFFWEDLQSVMHELGIVRPKNAGIL